MAGAVAGGAGGITELARLLRELRPVLHSQRFGFGTIDRGAPPPADVFALVHEAEGLTVIAPEADGKWARISLTVHSSLSAVGLSAAIARALADRALPANIVAGYHHDHVFVPWDRRHEAVATLAALSEHHS